MAEPLALFGYGIYLAIIACSLLAAGVVVERIRRIRPWQRRFSRTQQALATGQQALIGHLHDQPAEADDPLTHCLRRGLGARSRGGSEAVRTVALEAAQQAVAGLERGLGILVTIAQVAPLLGLLGTVAGLMQAFQAASEAEQITTGLLAGGIYQALGTTAAGLTVAIPSWIAFNSLEGWIGRLVMGLERAIAELPELVAVRGKDAP